MPEGMVGDVIAVIEAAYKVGSDDEWLESVVHAGRAIGDCYALLVQRSPFRYLATASSISGIREKLMRYENTAVDSVSAAALWSLFLPSPPVEHTLSREARVARAHSLPVDWLRATAKRRWNRDDRAMFDAVGVCAGDPEGEQSMVLAFTNRKSVSAREKNVLSKLSAHLTAAMRIRALTRPASAVLDSRGRVVDVDATAQRDCSSLVEAARAIDRSRGRLRRASPEAAATLWRAMVAGRWSLVDFVDRDGKQFLLARENDPLVRDIKALTRVECSVVGYVALGHSNKHIGYELGLAPSTVASHLSRALRKLHLSGRRALIARLARTQ